MKKIFTAAQIHELDQYTIDHEPIKSIDLMERAARAITDAIVTEDVNVDYDEVMDAVEISQEPIIEE